jgi:glycosyltransferase involved in cell wall biosynthesis
MKFSVILPTRGRPDQAVSCVERLFETTVNHDVECVVVVDEDDATVSAFESSMGLRGRRVRVIHQEKRSGPVVAMNLGLKHTRPDADAYITGADDLWWGTGWLDEALKGLGQIGGDGLVGFNDTVRDDGDKFSTHYLMTRNFMIEHHGGVMLIPHYKSYYTDPESGERARRAGKYIWCQDSIVKHRHPWHGEAPMDETYRMGSKNHDFDLQTFRYRTRHGFPDNFDPIKGPHKFAPRRVYWAVLPERAVVGPPFNHILGVAEDCALRGYERLRKEYGRTDFTRNEIVFEFMSITMRPDDILVMIDADHYHPRDIVHALVSQHSDGLLGAWARRRSPPHDVMAWRRVDGKQVNIEDLDYHIGETWNASLVGAAAIAINRKTFDTLNENGCRYPFFRYAYQDNNPFMPSEDVYFCGTCESAGVPMAVHTGIVTPHMIFSALTEDKEEESEAQPSP